MSHVNKKNHIRFDCTNALRVVWSLVSCLLVVHRQQTKTPMNVNITTILSFSLPLFQRTRARVCSMPLPPLKLVLLIQLYSTVRTSPWHGAHLLISHKPEVFSYSNIRANFIMLPSSYCVCLLSGILSTQIDRVVQIDGNTGTIWSRMLMLMHCQVLRIGEIMFSGVSECNTFHVP